MNLLRALALSLFVCAAAAFADNPACHSPQGANQATVSVSSNSAATLVSSVNGQVIHVCAISFALPEANTVQLQGSDLTVLDGPYRNTGSYFIWWDGQLSTARAAIGSALQIKFTNAPSSAVGVTVTYYLGAY